MTSITTTTVEKLTTAWNTKSPEKILEHFAEDATAQFPQTPQPVKGKAAIKEYLATQFKAFPDQQINLQDSLVSGKKAAASGTWNATNTGPLPLPTGQTIPATNKKVTGEWSAHVTYDDKGKVKSFKLYADNLSVLTQLGLVPQQ